MKKALLRKQTKRIIELLRKDFEDLEKSDWDLAKTFIMATPTYDFLSRNFSDD